VQSDLRFTFVGLFSLSDTSSHGESIGSTVFTLSPARQSTNLIRFEARARFFDGACAFASPCFALNPTRVCFRQFCVHNRSRNRRRVVWPNSLVIGESRSVHFAPHFSFATLDTVRATAVSLCHLHFSSLLSNRFMVRFERHSSPSTSLYHSTEIVRYFSRSFSSLSNSRGALDNLFELLLSISSFVY
jgi:hypothetical protein